MSADVDFEKLVKGYYRDLYRFGFSLTGSEADAAEFLAAEQKVAQRPEESRRLTSSRVRKKL